MSRRSSRLSSQQIVLSSSPVASTSYDTSLPAGPPFARTYTASASGATEKNEVPYFEEWPTEKLQAEVKRYGFKVSRKRATLIDQLKAVYQALHKSKAPFEPPDNISEPNTDAGRTEDIAQRGRSGKKRKSLSSAINLDEDIEVSTGTMVVKGRAKGKGRKSDPFILEVSSDSSSQSSSSSVIIAEEAGDYTAQLEREALSATEGELSSDSLSSWLPLSASASPSKPSRRRRSRSSGALSSSSEDVPLALGAGGGTEELLDEAEVVDPSPALADTMTTAIRTDAQLWTRILRYEPISFDELMSTATSAGLAMDTGKRKEELRTWLDRQCICFYSAELTGPRSRH